MMFPNDVSVVGRRDTVLAYPEGSKETSGASECPDDGDASPFRESHSLCQREGLSRC